MDNYLKTLTYLKIEVASFVIFCDQRNILSRDGAFKELGYRTRSNIPDFDQIWDRYDTVRKK